MKQSFKAGDIVSHSRLGEGTILDEWGTWIDLYERGNELPVTQDEALKLQPNQTINRKLTNDSNLV